MSKQANTFSFNFDLNDNIFYALPITIQQANTVTQQTMSKQNTLFEINYLQHLLFLFFYFFFCIFFSQTWRGCFT